MRQAYDYWQDQPGSPQGRNACDPRRRHTRANPRTSPARDSTRHEIALATHPLKLKDRPTVHFQSRTHTEARTTPTTQLPSPTKRVWRRLAARPVRGPKRASATAANATRQLRRLARAAQQASTRKSQCSVHKPHSRPTANDAQARSNATNVDATKTWRTNREGAAPLTPAVQPPDPTQHRS